MEASEKIFKKVWDSFYRKHNLNEERNVLLVFLGFPNELYQGLIASGVKHFGHPWNNTYIDCKTIDKKDLYSAVITEKGLRWAFYEEFIALTEILADFSLYDGEIRVVKNNLFLNYYPLPVNVSVNEAESFFDDKSFAKDNDCFRRFYSDYKISDDVLFLAYVNKHYIIDVGINIPEYDFYDAKEMRKKVSLNNITTSENIAMASLSDIKCKLQIGELENKKYIIKSDVVAMRNALQIMLMVGSYYNVSFEIAEYEKKDINKINKRYLPIMKKYWGVDADFKDRKFYKEPTSSTQTVDISQGQIIDDIVVQCENAINTSIVQYSDLIVTAPTGAGKSLFFQVPGIYLKEQYDAVTIVVCPLVALMVDQEKEVTERGISYCTYINSSLTYEERQSRLDGIKNGRYSIVYLSPELLLAYDIHNFIGGRKIGLLVVDEAHLVTSWGRDFRVDYWFLGDYIEKVRRGSYYSKADRMNFPVLCLTATAVNGGRDDIVNDLQNSLHLTCYSEHIYIGYVRRDNISFKIYHGKKKYRSDKEEKIYLTAKAIDYFIKQGEKTIIYFPYKSSIEDVMNYLMAYYPDHINQVEKYYSGTEMKSMEKDEAYSNFRDSQSLVMLATKAFGMGVNIPDVVNVYHYAPTGTLADYVQEIGRAGRKLDNGIAITDYLPTDMKYARTLWGLSGLRHYQLKAIMKKIYELYQSKNNNRNLLFSPETFSYLFDERDIDTRVKSGLMLISTDLIEKYHFKVITVRPKNMFTSQYIIVPYDVEMEFLERYGRYCKQMNDCRSQIEIAHGWTKECVIMKVGNIFEIDLANLWEIEFNDKTFAQFKYNFFSGSLFSFANDKIVPNMKMIITYDKGYEQTKEDFSCFAAALQKAFNDIKRSFGGRQFTLTDFMELLVKHYGKKLRREYINMLLDLFCYEHVDLDNIPREPWKFIVRGKSESSTNANSTIYYVRLSRYAGIESILRRYIKQSQPNINEKQYVTYLPIPKDSSSRYSYKQLLASILQLFDFASYELIGGRNPQVFVRINDPLKLKRIVESDRVYKNGILFQIEERHKRAVTIMNKFMESERSDDERWSIIEDYFLGDDTVVDFKLGISNMGQGYDKTKDKKNIIVNENLDVVFNAGDLITDYYSDWEDARSLTGVEKLIQWNIPFSDFVESTFIVGDKSVDVQFAWEMQKVALLDQQCNSKILSTIEKSGWHCFVAELVNEKELKAVFGG